MQDEIWREVPGYEGLYEVSNRGAVRSLCYNGGGRKSPKVLRPAKNTWGYLQVGLHKGGKTKRLTVHRLVAEAFLQNPLNLPELNHKDEDKTDNFVFVDEAGNTVPERSNLEWCDRSHNINYGTRNNRVSKALTGRRPSPRRPVLQFDLEGNLIREWSSANEVEKHTGWSHGDIAKCCLGKPYFKSSHGFLWRYTEDVPCDTEQGTLF